MIQQLMPANSKTTTTIILFLQMFLLLQWSRTACTEIVFLGQQPFRAYISLASFHGQEVYQIYAVESQTGVSDGITYGIVQNSDLGSLFQVVPQTGQVNYVSGSLAFREYNLTVAAMTDSQSVEASITITVTLESDTVPRFEHAVYSITVPESVPIGVAFSVIRTFAPNIDVVASPYSIVGGNVNSDIAIEGTTGLLRANRALDRERTESYTLVVRYISSACPMQTTVRIFVLDVNDNSPQFSEPFYNISIPETTAIGDFIMNISATDPDFGDNGSIMYSFVPTASQTFSLDSETGALTVIATLDYERQTQYYFTVTASDGGMPSISSTVMVLVNLINVDDECPQFENPLFISEVPYDPANNLVPNIGMALVTVRAYDPDRLSTVTYSLESSTDNSNLLTLGRNTGTITLSRVDPSIRGLYILNVSASDRNCDRESFVPVEIGIGSRNSHSPRFQTDCAAMLYENPPVGTEIVTLTAADEDIGLNGVITYSLLTQTDLFGVDPSSGTVRTVAEPGEYDRETQSQFYVDVIARDGGNRQDYCQLTITLLDLNDNSPQILLPNYDTTLFRGVQPGTFVLEIEASDNDLGGNGTISYSLNFPEGALPPFAIDTQSGIITTNGSLSSGTTYTFSVVATDMGEPLQLSSTAVVRISIADDLSFPLFNQTIYSGEQDENIPFRTSILTVYATSTSANDPISYEIVSGSEYRSNSDEAFRIFTMSSGAEIDVGSSVIVDYERLLPSSFFSFFVRATNSAGSSIASVKIDITDDDDSIPEFLPDLSISLAENEPIGTTVLQLQAMDADSGTNGEISYRLSVPSSFFNVTQEGMILSNHIFDAEDSSETLAGVILVEAFNPNGNQDSRMTERISWMIVDVNDNPLSFAQFSYSATLPENQTIQSVVLTLEAVDPDSSNNNNLQYFITEGNDGTFEIHSNNLVLARRLDYETTSSYTLQVQVTDGQHTGCTQCIATVNIHVSDIDDEPPVFTLPIYNAQVIENAPIGTFVLNISATDSDSSEIHYDLLGLALGRFTVDTNGMITVNGHIDREGFLPDGELVFLALAEGGHIASAEVRVTISDINDLTPRFAEVYRGRVHENISPGEEGIRIVQVRANDLDAGRNGSVTYSLVDGEDAGFRIDPISGIVTSHAVLDREAQPSYTITVRAADNGIPTSLSSTSHITIDVGDDNDNRPFFPFPFMFARVFENSPIGTHVVNIPAIDLDNGSNATITYTLESFSPSEVKFDLNSETGEVTVSGSLDYEIPLHRVYTLIISIRDPQLQAESEGTLVIHLLDQNDNAPVIQDPVYELGAFILPENLPADEMILVASINASDEDSGLNSVLMFEISGGNVNQVFSIVDENGVAKIHIVRQLDHETTPIYRLLITVSDKGAPPQSSTTELTFRVNDVNDESPVFLEPMYTATIQENSSPQSSILQVNATDPDSGSGGTISGYNIESGNDGGWFVLDPVQGTLGTTVMFDREERSSYTLTVTALDGGTVSMTGSVSVEISISDVNDNPSLFGGVLYIHIYALDGQAPAGVISVPNFNDSDIDDSFEACIVRFQSSQLTTVFGIDEQNCHFSLLNSQPPEGTYNFQYRGRDGMHTSVLTNVSVEVDHIPSTDLPQDSLVTVTVNASADEYFSNKLNVSFPTLIAGALGVEGSLLRIVSVQPGYHDPDRSVDVTFTARQTSSDYINPTVILSDLFLQKDNLVVGEHTVTALPTDPCASEPCFNQAACKNLRMIGATELVARSKVFVLLAPRVELDYECECVPGTSGSSCEINYDDCYSNPCMQNAQCFDEVGGFQCDCPDGASGPDCSFNPDECVTNPCMNGATCVNGLNTYVCECLPGYYGRECQYRYYSLSTVCSSNPCRNGATCSPGRDTFTCLCLEGFSGQLCDVEEQAQGGCLRNPCYNGSSCTDTSEGPVCSCSVGFTGPNCRWPLNNCELQPCLNGGICQQGLYGSYRCICAAGFSGENCSIITPACNSNPCQNGSRCQDQPDGTYVCECTRYYSGMNCDIPVMPLDLCSVAGTLQPCIANGICTSGRDDYTCSCMTGYSGRDCSQEVDTTSPSLSPCHSNPCQHGGTCIDESSMNNGTYSCTCSTGFTGENCETNFDDCFPDLCLNGGVCNDGVNGFVCNCSTRNTGRMCEVFCPEGQEGEFCEVTVLSCSEDRCSNGGTCIEEPAGSFSCVCSPGFTGTRCEVVNDCSVIKCLNGGTCIQTSIGVYGCDCEDGFEGRNCELLTISFSGSSSQSSYRAYSSLDIRGQGNISFEFATLEMDGLLLYNTQYQGGESVDFVVVEIAGGLLRVSVSQGDGTARVSVVSSALSVSDGQWHQVTVETSGQRVRVLLDFCQLFEEGLLTLADCSASASNSGNKSFLDLGLPLWLGGVPSELPLLSTPHISSRGVTGCIRSVYIGGELLDLESHLKQENSAPGCAQIEEVCLSQAPAPVCSEGECIPMLGSHRCVCPPQVAGDSCENAAENLMFGGRTFAKYTLISNTQTTGVGQRRKRQSSNQGSLRSSLSEQISLRFRTEVDNGLLFYMGSGVIGDSAFIQVDRGALVYGINLGSSEERIPLPQTLPVTDSQWHYFEVTRIALELSLTLDNLTFSHSLGGTHLNLDINTSQVFAGGRLSLIDTSTILNPYTGCLQDIRVDQNVLPTLRANSFASVTFGGSEAISKRCALRGCFPNPCGIGNCTEQGEMGYVCMCSDGSSLISQPCPEPRPSSSYTLAIIIGCVAAVLIVCVTAILLGMLCYVRQNNRKASYVVDARQGTTSDEFGLYGRDCLVISNDQGGGEQDTSMTADRFNERYVSVPNRKDSVQVTVSPASSDESFTKEPLDTMEETTASKLSAVLSERIAAANEELKDVDSLREFCDEGSDSEATVLSSICTDLNGEGYTVERLQEAGAGFAVFVNLLETVIAEEEDDLDSASSQVAHTGKTQDC